MERIKRLRTPQRTLLTKVIKGAETELEKEECSRQTLYEKSAQIQRNMAELRALDGKYREAMLDEGATEAEILAELERIEEYEEKVTAVQTKIEHKLAPPMPRPGSPSQGEGSVSSYPDLKKRTFKLPKIELRKFNSELREWLGWWAQFSKIHEDESLHESDKFHYLIQAIDPTTEARDIVCSYPQTAENYEKAIEALKERFGRPTLLLQVYIRELLQLVIINVHAEKKMPLDQLHLKLESHLRSLASLNLAAADPATWLYPLVESSLPEEVMRAWQRSSMLKADGAKDESKKTKLDILMEFLKHEVQAEQQISLAKTGFRGDNIKPDPKKEVMEKVKLPKKEKDGPTAASLYSGTSGSCIFCGKDNHSSTDCYAARKLSAEQKQAKVKEARRCYNCLKIGHPVAKCKIPPQCFICRKKHHSLLCSEATERNQEPTKEEQKTMTAMTSVMDGFPPKSHQQQVVLMKTIHVKVRGSSGKEKEVRLLFDDGSQKSYMKTSLAKELKCVKLGETVIQNCVFGGQVTKVKKQSQYLAVIRGACTGYKDVHQEASLLGETVLTGLCPCVPVGPWVEVLAGKGVHLNDTWAHSSDVDILIGSDLWGKYMTGRMIKLENSLIAMESIFGWTLSGEINGRIECQQKESTAGALTTTMLYNSDMRLTDLWKLETIGINDPVEKIQQEEHDMNVKRVLQEGMTKDKDGRYVVRLPWISDGLIVLSNKEIAEKRLISCTKRLKTEELNEYSKIFHDWEKENIIERVPGSVTREHFLPHRPVFKESLTTPVRPVFDASCRGRQGPSLNDCLEKGPNLLELLSSVLLRFREKKIGATSDIRKAFQMIAVDEKDRDFQKFLWWEKTQDTMMQFRHCRVVFGINCSPFILAAVLEWHLRQVCPEDKEVAAKLQTSLYVDNSVISFDTTQEYEEFQEKATRILADAKMDLRQWENSHEDSVTKVTTVLGMKWNKETDQLYCQVPGNLDVEGTFAVTKRSVLSMTARVFDPIGLACPVMIVQKKKLQVSWSEGLNWDQPWDMEESQSFRKWCQEVAVLDQLRIPRWAFGTHGDVRGVELHCFTDACQDSYAAVVYGRSETEQEVTVQLLLAKARLAPLNAKTGNRITIPRLELLGCLIGTRLTRTVQEALTRKDIPVTIWSDSTTALAWISRNEDWGTFVGNRVREIKKLSEGWNWRHVAGDRNPADLPSRGCSPTKLLESRWWEGPEWLKKPAHTWTQNTSYVTREEDILSERKKTASHHTTELSEPRFSSYGKNIRVMAYVRRFVDNLKKSKNKVVLERSPFLTPEEITTAERDVLEDIQKRHFKRGQKFSGLWIQLDRDGLLHVKTRLDLKQDWDAFKFPILLLNQDPLVEQLIRDTHKRMGHSGTQVVLNCLREKYWILKGRRAVNRVLQKCVICRRHQGKKMDTVPSPLPTGHVETQFAFQTTGVDLAGPILLKDKKKVWIVLYTCAVYRGVYLDWVPSLGVQDFMDSLQKFCCEVGRPNTLYSDNGTNFVAAAKLLKRMNWRENGGKLNEKEIRWIFNPPSAAWWGGWWERLIRSMKDLLRKMLGSACLSTRDLTKCLAAVAYVMNTRPLTTITEDPNDLRPLTPLMFMRDLPVSGLPESAKVTQQNLQDTFGRVIQMKEALKSRFRKEYLAMLVQRRNEKKTTVPNVGDVVLMEVHNKKRCEWPLAKIIELYPGKDGEIRVAKLKVRNGEVTRPLQRLYPLEVPVRTDLGPQEPMTESNAETKDDPVRALEEETEVSTRARRKIVKPNRYGQWNYN